MLYKIINSGSDGNCTILNDSIAIDLGISYKKFEKYSRNIKLVLLTHEHSDHFNKTTIRKLAYEHPMVKFVCLKHLAKQLAIIIPKKNIYVLEANKLYNLGICKVAAFNLTHDVPNCGWRVMVGNEKCIYATDTTNLNGIKAKDYDLYLIEGNYDLTEMLKTINDKKANGEYSYEVRAMQNHLSIQQCNEFLQANMNESSKFVYMHQHKEKLTNGKVEINNNIQS